MSNFNENDKVKFRSIRLPGRPELTHSGTGTVLDTRTQVEVRWEDNGVTWIGWHTAESLMVVEGE